MNKICCEEIEILDSDGNVKFRISGNLREGSLFELIGESGEPLLEIGQRDDGNVFIRINALGASGRGVYIGNPEGIPTLSLNGEGKLPAICFELEEYQEKNEGGVFRVMSQGELILEKFF